MLFTAGIRHGKRKFASYSVSRVDKKLICRTNHAILCCVVGGTVDVASLSKIIVNRVRDLKTTPEELKDAFQVFDKQGTGMISVHDLKLSLTTLGERLADEELDELIREVDQDGEGMVNYQGVAYYNVITSTTGWRV